MSGFSDRQVRALKAKLSEKHVRERHEAGLTLSYIEGWHTIAEANRIFGFDGWHRETVETACVWQGNRSGRPACSYIARVRIRVSAGDKQIVREGSGSGHGEGFTLGEAHESALKEAETDATKRALSTFGNPFGLALYDREQRGVRKVASSKSITRWPLRAGNGDLIAEFLEPIDWCAALRSRIEAQTTHRNLRDLQGANQQTLRDLVRTPPNLRNDKGLHYANLLEGLIVKRLDELESSAYGRPMTLDRRGSNGSSSKQKRTPGRGRSSRTAAPLRPPRQETATAARLAADRLRSTTADDVTPYSGGNSPSAEALRQQQRAGAGRTNDEAAGAGDASEPRPANPQGGQQIEMATTEAACAGRPRPDDKAAGRPDDPETKAGAKRDDVAEAQGDFRASPPTQQKKAAGTAGAVATGRPSARACARARTDGPSQLEDADGERNGFAQPLTRTQADAKGEQADLRQAAEITTSNRPEMTTGPSSLLGQPIDKSTLPLGEPKRIRDPEHLKVVARQPCLICGRQPSQAHHITYAQPAAMGRKVSDEWVVPLCAIHHRQLHDAGDEKKWWGRQGLEPVSVAEAIWRARNSSPID